MVRSQITQVPCFIYVCLFTFKTFVFQERFHPNDYAELNNKWSQCSVEEDMVQLHNENIFALVSQPPHSKPELQLCRSDWVKVILVVIVCYLCCIITGSYTYKEGILLSYLLQVMVTGIHMAYIVLYEFSVAYCFLSMPGLCVCVDLEFELWKKL